jgi:hypothetical protein
VNDGLRIGMDLWLPAAFVGMRTPVFASPEAGKSVFVAVLMEELWRARLQFVAFDLLGTGWGVKTSADGKSAGIAVPYLGGSGRYADAPLRPDGGAIVARALIETGSSMMLNLAAFTQSEQCTFVADLWDELLRLAGERHEAGAPISLLNLIDEAALVMPEFPRSKEQARAREAGVRLARLGRSLGLGYVATTQRGQSLDKNVVGMWEVFMILRLSEKRAIDAAIGEIEHVVGREAAREIRESLPHLANGEAWIVAPRALGFTRRVQLRMRETYDSTRTPARGERRPAPTQLAQADLSALRAALAAPPIPADPPAARGSKTSGRPRTLKRERPPTIERVEVPVLTAQERSLLDRAAQAAADIRIALDALTAALGAIERRLAPTLSPAGPADALSANGERAARKNTKTHENTSAVHEIRVPRAAAPAGKADGFKAGQRRMLGVLAQCGGTLTKMQLATLADVNRGSGTFSIYLRGLVDAGFVQADATTATVMPAGAAHIGVSIRQGPPSTAEIVQTYSAKLKAGARRMLDILVATYPADVTKLDLAARAEVNRESGTFSIYLRTLQSNGLVETSTRTARASATLFLQT